MRRVLAPVVLLCLLASGCGSLVEIEVAAVDRTALDAPEQTEVYAADGSLIATLRSANRQAVSREDLPEVLVDAIVAAEDRRFFSHEGIDLRAVARAAVANRRAGEVVQGGSTLTQQLVKNRYFPDAEQTLERKAAEAQMAVELERESTKDEILTDYLNTVYLGDGAYGVQAGARRWFGIDAAALDLPRAALLAGMVRAPESARPDRDPERALAERTRVLDGMVDTDAIDRASADAAAGAPLDVAPPEHPPTTRYPYFVEHVKRILLADPAFGFDESTRIRRLYGGGLRIDTTVDPAVQDAAERAAHDVLGAPQDPEVGVAVVRPADGHLVAVVGGRDFAARQFDVATQARRQPGSTMKTFALVAALRDGGRLDDVVESGPAVLDQGAGFEPWSVRSATTGPMSLRDGLVESSNGAYARLGLSLGAGRVADQAAAMGLESDLGSNPALILGGTEGGVSPLDLAGAYGTLANAGVHQPTVAVTGVTDAGGFTFYRQDSAPTVAMDGEVAWLVTQALRGVIDDDRGTGTAARLDRPAAGKTGTSQDNADAWFVGFTPELSAAVWVGDPDARRPLVGIQGITRVDGGTLPALIWQRLMSDALAGRPVQEFRYPSAQEVSVAVDPTTGGLATPYCPLRVEVRGLRGELPAQPCPVHTAPALRPETATVVVTPGPVTRGPAVSPAPVVPVPGLGTPSLPVATPSPSSP